MKSFLVINAGSSSLKFALFQLPLFEGAQATYRGQVDGIGSDARFKIKNVDNSTVLDAIVHAPANANVESPHQAALDALLAWFDAQSIELAAVGHRVVHGGSKFSAPVRLTAALIEELKALCPLAPLHQSHNLRPMHAISRKFPELPQVACFDTAFHRTQNSLAEAFALPRALSAEGIKRYGFHGSSYEYVARQLPNVLGDKARGAVVIAHLGNGASMCAMRNLQSTATTMGFTAVDGLMMGTRTGNLDPGVILYLMDRHGYDSPRLTNLLYKESGLLGVSGISQDMRTLLASDSPHAKEAVELFCYRAARELGSLMMTIGGLDALVFTGGIGEHAAPVRAEIIKHLAWLGAELDDTKNTASNPERIETSSSRVAIAVVPTNEEWMIAHHTYALLQQTAS